MGSGLTVAELIEALQALPKEAQSKPVIFVIEHNMFSDISRVEYDLTTVALHP